MIYIATRKCGRGKSYMIVGQTSELDAKQALADYLATTDESIDELFEAMEIGGEMEIVS